MHKQGRRRRRPRGGPPLTSQFGIAVVAVLIASYLLLVFLVPVVLSAIVSYRSLPRTVGCPQCARETVALHRRALKLLGCALPRLRLHRRWCLHCGWEGFSRAPAAVLSPLLAPERPVPATALDVRSLRVDGRTWRVQLQCWRDVRRCYGRLVFIEPNGRPLADGLQAFSGATQFEVLGQALSIPDRTLASRLRQLLIAES